MRGGGGGGGGPASLSQGAFHLSDHSRRIGNFAFNHEHPTRSVKS